MQAQTQPAPLVQAHAHNDYEHKRPLFDALDRGFCSVEADIHLVSGELRVAHDLLQVKPGRTLQSLYLDPLRERVKRNAGRVYVGGPEFTLLIDIKSDWRTTYPVLRAALKEYSDLLNVFGPERKRTNAVTAILTGNRSLEMFKGETDRYAAYDGQLTELDSSEPADLIPWISSSWGAISKWRGSGEMPEDDKTKVAGIVAKAHQRNRRVRFWGAPDQPEFWRQMLEQRVDLINTDDLPGLQNFLLTSGAAKKH